MARPPKNSNSPEVLEGKGSQEENIQDDTGAPQQEIKETSVGEPQNELEKHLSDFPVEHIRVSDYAREITDQEVQQIVEHVRTGYGISYRTSINGICEMIRRGGAAKGTPVSFSVEVFCPDEGVAAVLMKRDIVRAVELVCKGRRNFRNLAVKLAPFIVRSGLRRQAGNPELDMSGDLARKINNRLIVRKEKPLSPAERVGCASYAQHIPDLDSLCSSDRLLHLLAEDLDMRSNVNKGPKQGQVTTRKGKAKNASGKENQKKEGKRRTGK